jgi:hypothetical protein
MEGPSMTQGPVVGWGLPGGGGGWWLVLEDADAGLVAGLKSEEEVRWDELDIDDHHAALALLAGRSHGRPIPGIATMTIHRKVDSTPLTFTALFLFLLEDLFDDPGIQHGGPPFGLMCGLTSRSHALLIRSVCVQLVQPAGLGMMFLRELF